MRTLARRAVSRPMAQMALRTQAKLLVRKLKPAWLYPLPLGALRQVVFDR